MNFHSSIFLFAIDILNDLVYQTILYSTQERPEKPISIILMTLRNSLLLVLFICQSQNSLVHVIIGAQNSVSCVSDLMGVTRFKEIKRFIHFNDNK